MKIFIVKANGEIVACTTNKQQAWEIADSISLDTEVEEWFDRAAIGWGAHNASIVEETYGRRRA